MRALAPRAYRCRLQAIGITPAGRCRDTLLEPSRLYGGKLELRAINVTALGPETALAVVAFTEGLLRDPTDRFPGVLTAVSRRVDGQWRAISIHKSSVPMAGE
jgi:hypothetical protein